MKLLNLLLIILFASSTFAADEVVPELDVGNLPFVEDSDEFKTPEFSEEELPSLDEISENQVEEVAPFSESELPFIEESEQVAPLGEEVLEVNSDTAKIETTLDSENSKSTIISGVSNFMFFLYSLGFLLIVGLIVYFSRHD